MKTSELKPYPDNPRIHGDGDGLQKSILKYGDLSGVVFNVKNNQLVGGHYRSKTIPKESVIKSCKVTDITGTTAEGTIILPSGQRLNYREVDWDEQTHKEACIIANNPKIQGDWDVDLLEPGLNELYSEMEDFGDFKLDELAADFDLILGEVGEFDPTLPTGGKPEIKTMTFTLSTEQAGLVDSMIKKEIQSNPVLDDPSGINENKNGNALYSILRSHDEC